MKEIKLFIFCEEKMSINYFKNDKLKVIYQYQLQFRTQASCKYHVLNYSLTDIFDRFKD
jgi:hypothetical protein